MLNSLTSSATRQLRCFKQSLRILQNFASVKPNNEGSATSLTPEGLKYVCPCTLEEDRVFPEEPFWYCPALYLVDTFPIKGPAYLPFTVDRIFFGGESSERSKNWSFFPGELDGFEVPAVNSAGSKLCSEPAHFISRINPRVVGDTSLTSGHEIPGTTFNANFAYPCIPGLVFTIGEDMTARLWNLHIANRSYENCKSQKKRIPVQIATIGYGA